MKFGEYVRALRGGWIYLVSFLAVGAFGGVALTLLTPKVYQATVQVFVATDTTDSAAQLQAGNVFARDRVQTYTSIANSPAITSTVIEQLALSLTNAQLAAKITADAPQNKVLINLHVEDGSAQHAAALANAVGARFIEVVEGIEQTDATGKSVVKLTVTRPATAPTSPIRPDALQNVVIGLICGLIAGCGFVILRDVLDNTVKGTADFESLGVPMLGHVPLDKRTAQMPVAFRADPHSARSEAYRQIRTNLQFVNVDEAPRIIAVTSPVSGEGKTVTALNLAASLAEGGFKVCLIEADLRRPTLARSLGLVGEAGFTTALIGKAPVTAVLQNAGRNLAVLTSGPIPPNPSELLISDQARLIINEIAAQVDYTIIDTAPLLPVSDGAEVAVLADATILVQRAGKSTRNQAARAIDALTKVGRKPVGVVLNMVPRGGKGYDVEYAYDGEYRPERSRRAADRSNPTDSA